MPNELISKDDAVKALEEYAFALAENCGLQASHIAFECLRRVRKLHAFGEERRSKWITVHGYIQCPHCGTHGYKSWKRCPVCEMKMEG